MRKIGQIGQIGLIRPIVLALMLVLLTACGGGGSDSISGGEVVPPPTNPEQGGGDTPYSAGPAMGFSAVCADTDGQGASSAPRRGMRRAAGDPQPGDGEFTTDSLQASGFGVYCWYTGNKSVPEFEGEDHIKNYADTILMLNQKVEYINSLWTYSPTKYWPLQASHKLTFRAYAPYVSYQLQNDKYGMPMLPVVVAASDYHNGTQHDPLWGTNGESAKNEVGKHTYGALYDNYTYAMSGSSTSTDERDGTIDWYFHHGMSKLMFSCSLVKDPGCQHVTIKGIMIENLYTQGLLSLSSPTGSKDEKPYWNERSGDMTVTLNGATTTDNGKTWTAGDLAPAPEQSKNPYAAYPYVIDVEEPIKSFDLLSKGLLIIPHTFTSEDKMTITVAYTIDNETGTTLEAKAEIKDREFFGNTSYTLNMKLTPSTKGLEITTVQAAFTSWKATVEGDHTVYNW
jgi:hypothetical protein